MTHHEIDDGRTLRIAGLATGGVALALGSLYFAHEASTEAEYVSVAGVAIYTAVIAQLAKRLPARSDQVEEDPAERRVRVEHAEHGGDAEPLPPQQ